MSDLAAAVLAVERDIEPAAVPDTARDELTEELFTEHLPKLTATDTVRTIRRLDRRDTALDVGAN